MGNAEVTQGEIPLRDMESNAVVRFSDAFKARFDTASAEEKAGWASTTLAAQDTVFADHLVAAKARFAIIEFKATFNAIGTESGKKLRQKLFKALALKSDFLRRCLDFHMVCWGTIRRHQPPGFSASIDEEIDMLNRYALKVAPFIDVGLTLKASPDMTTKAFLDQFLGSRMVGGTYERFKKYLDELGALAGGVNGDSSTIQGMLCVYLPGDAQTPGRYAYARFRGLEELQFLLQPRGKEKAHELQRSKSRDRNTPSERDFGPRF